MILIISNTYDESGVMVFKNINKAGYESNLISISQFRKDFILNYDFGSNSSEIISKITCQKVKAIWIKKFGTTILNDFKGKQVHDEIMNTLKMEELHLFDFLFQNGIFQNCYVLSSFKDRDLNKLNILKEAIRHELKIPPTTITNSKKYLEDIKRRKELIIKNIYENFSISIDGTLYTQYVDLIDDNLIHNLSDFFFPIAFQERIVKEFEVRTFYFLGKTYSVAYFQPNKNAKVDVREERSHQRIEPYNLPENITIKLQNLMSSLNLEIGAIDFLVDKEGTHFFLEVNPNGNFRVVSEIGEYSLEKIIANHLISKYNEL